MYKETIWIIFGGMLVGCYGVLTYSACKRFTLLWTVAGIVCASVFGMLLSKLWYGVKSIIKCSKLAPSAYDRVSAQGPLQCKKAFIFNATTVKADILIYLCYLLSSYLIVWWYVKYLFSVLVLVRDAPSLLEIFPLRYVCCNPGSPTVEMLKIAGVKKGIYKYQDKVMHSIGAITPEMFLGD